MSWLLLVALVLRAAVPAGFMPDVRADTAFTLVVCTPHGLTTRTVDESGQPLSSQAQDTADTICSFAGVGSPILPTAPADAHTAQMPRDVGSLLASVSAPRILAIHGALGARAPPKAFSGSV